MRVDITQQRHQALRGECVSTLRLACAGDARAHNRRYPDDVPAASRPTTVRRLIALWFAKQIEDRYEVDGESRDLDQWLAMPNDPVLHRTAGKHLL